MHLECIITLSGSRPDLGLHDLDPVDLRSPVDPSSMFAQVFCLALFVVANGRECHSPISDDTAESCSAWRQPLLRGDDTMGCPQHAIHSGAPRGLAFVGLSLSRGPDSSPRYAPTANRASVTHQDAWTRVAVDRRSTRFVDRTGEGALGFVRQAT